MASSLRKRILVLRLDEIGDFVLSTALLRELRKIFPSAHIGLVVKPELKNLAETCPYIDRLYTYKPQAGGFFAKSRLFWRKFSLAKRHLRHYDLAILPRWDADDAGAFPLAYLSGAKLRMGYSEFVSERKRTENKGYNRYLTHPIEDVPGMVHEVKKNLHLLRFLGKNVISDALELWITPSDTSRAKEYLFAFRRKDHPLFALGVGASRPHKTWPLSHFIELCKKLIRQYHAQFVVIGGAKEEKLGKQLEAELGADLLNLAGKLTLRESAAVAKECAIFIGNDTGPKHIAAAMQTPVIEITYHPKAQKLSDRFRPWKVLHEVVHPCEGEGISDITPETLFKLVMQFYEKRVLDKDATAFSFPFGDALGER